jgi:hypothetical protein
MRGRRLIAALACTLAITMAACGGTDDDDFVLFKTQDEPATAAVGQVVTLEVEVRTSSGRVVEDVEVDFVVERGGGSVAPAQAVTDSEGRATVEWTLGVVPVPNQMAALAGDARVEFTTQAVLSVPPPG